MQVIALTECFRCGSSIVDAANRLIAVNNEPFCEPMVCATGRIGTVELLTGRSADIVRRVQQLPKLGFAAGDIAVMARSHRVLARLAEIMREAEIPHHRVGARFEICSTDEFRELAAALRLCVNPKDNLAFLCMSPRLGLNQVQLATIRSEAAAKGWSYFDAAIALGFRNALVAAIQAMQRVEGVSIAIVIPEIMTAMPRPALDDGWAWLKSRDFWRNNCDEMPIADALRWYALRDSQDDVSHGNAVTLLTVHAAKGLEYPCVLVANCNEGDFPSSQSKTPEAIEEERRLFYVAMTRAKERLILHYRRPEDQAQDRKVSEPSRFLAEACVL